ncbi:hypothetical protein BDV25DRAFT_162615 [Aspergillus avenaceus]|uniref:Suppressor protein SRP40 n=1 Tax=Aspergillus avenaceus TaxID=36643 RepID=A0A5N6TJT3_ASPAV|nr:hypothetical protein BDV25DRAFT_162615 [Aspergillus avenaceus]
MTTASSTPKRLHITPFTPDILTAVIPASVRTSATEISFHTIPTFPENNYGYVTLPEMEADKIKKKLNGSILKGRKFKVEVARPQKRHRNEDESEPAIVNTEPSSSKKSKKRKPSDDVLDGYELPADRQVKRGWTESTTAMKERRKEEKKRKGKDEKEAKSQAKSKYTEKSECLFRTKVPPNRASEDKQDKASKKKKSTQESVVHEFSKTISQPSFIRSGNDGTAPTSTYEEGKGWIDSTGNIKEQANDRIRSNQHVPGKLPGAKEKPRSAKPPLQAESGSRKIDDKNTSRVSESLKESEESEDWTSSSGASSSSDDSITDSESEDSVTSSSSDESSPESIHRDIEKLPNNETGPGQENIEAEGNGGIGSQEVHPLEALFKRPAPDVVENKPDTTTDAQFSFFGQGDVDSDEETQAPPEPQTPFAKKDLQGRGLRSAAPTPDTALVGGTTKRNNLRDNVHMDVDDDFYARTPVPRPSAELKIDSDFTKWFWDNRGDNNRAWKKRRRDAAKEQRQRDNRRKGMKGKS